MKRAFNRTGKFLKAQRVSAKISQYEIANALKLESGQSVSNIERGLVALPPRHIKKLAALLHVSQAKLVSVISEDLIGHVIAEGKLRISADRVRVEL